MRLIRVLTIVAVVATACGGGSSDERRILIDFSHDEFSTFVLANSPKKVAVTQGQTLVFKQTWTGEPHTVTGGTAVSEELKSGSAWLDFFDAFETMMAAGADFPDPEDPGDAKFSDFQRALKTAEPRAARQTFIKSWKEVRSSGVPIPDLDAPTDASFAEVSKIIDERANSLFENLPFAEEEGADGLVQSVAQPCYLRNGDRPDDATKACDKSAQRQPVFDGKQAFYNSGILPYEGEQGNTFKIKLADDIDPGTYLFYCAVHGPQQMSQIEVRKRGAKIPSQSEVSRQARAGLDTTLKTLEKVYRQAARPKNEISFGDETLHGPFAGLYSREVTHAAINEFVPKTIRAKANEPIKWTMMGPPHTISFDVPSYFPIVDFKTPVRFNPKLDKPAGGAPEIPESEEPVLKLDGGTYDGEGFWSSGLITAEDYVEYTLRIAKPGTYDYACLVHPPMVGKIIVT